MDNEIKLFEGNKIRSVWDNEKEEWYFSVVDIVGVLSDSKNPRDYWYRVKKELTDEWKERGIVEEKDYAILTNEMTKAWSGLSVKEYKKVKGLKKEKLRDNMTNIELVLNMLAEVTTTAISKDIYRHEGLDGN